MIYMIEDQNNTNINVNNKFPISKRYYQQPLKIIIINFNLFKNINIIENPKNI